MPTKAKQTKLDIDAEPASKQYGRIEKLLSGYLVLEGQVRRYEKMANGENLLHQPNITMRPPDDDDPWVIASVVMEPLSEQQQEIVDVLSKYFDHEEFSYASCYRVAKKVADIKGDIEDEKAILQYAYALFQEAALGEERLKLTETERLAILRDKEIRRARSKLKGLKLKYNDVTDALANLQQFNEYEHKLLYTRYVLGTDWQKVCNILSPNSPLTRDEWINHRRKAMKAFTIWLPSYLSGVSEYELVGAL